MQRGFHVHKQGHCSEHAWIFFFISPNKCWVKQWAALFTIVIDMFDAVFVDCVHYTEKMTFFDFELWNISYWFRGRLQIANSNRLVNFVRNICIEMRCAEMYLCNWVFIAQLDLWKCKWDSIEFHSISRSISCSGLIHYNFIVVIWIIFEYIKCYILPLSKSNAIEWHVILSHPLHVSIVLHTIEFHRSQWK